MFSFSALKVFKPVAATHILQMEGFALRMFVRKCARRAVINCRPTLQKGVATSLNLTSEYLILLSIVMPTTSKVDLSDLTALVAKGNCRKYSRFQVLVYMYHAVVAGVLCTVV